MLHRSLAFGLVLLMGLSACSQQTTDTDLESKKQELYGLRDDKKKLNDQIKKLEDEIKIEDPRFEAVTVNTTLVSIMEVPKQNFFHNIEVRGRVASRQNVMISAEIPARIREIRVREGQRVNRGEVMLILDSETIDRNIDELKTQLDLAVMLYERQTRLWEQNVGSEVQYLEAKNRKESLEKRLATAYSQLNKTRIKAPFSGSVDEVSVKEGEFVLTGMPTIRVVSLKNLYIEADVSERYVGKFEKGDLAEIFLPAFEEKAKSQVVAISDVINMDNRTFMVEVSLDNIRQELKPNMIVVLTLTDYKNENATVLPTNIIQNDDKGPFVFTVKQNGKGLVAEKLHIETGMSFNSYTEVFSGIDPGQRVINIGHRDLTHGAAIQIIESES